ncbi:WD repeat-containing protein 43 isoform X1 [Cinnamomum micranthum f. kanehirae]|uniref:WD repeat-containing protein 43 isoform X1 n=1 Tax=Cinnamomum micranthum f. kanehirae TaxID=337451 RepID=A0A443N1J0_9MAGN|nr:WD repeat-containing protein 43 isoform X1 [Cinnamomum micranthum f. kanehirae]
MGRTNIKSLLTSFTSEGDFLAIVASDGNVKIWNTSSGDLLAEWKDPDGDSAGTYSCVACSFIGKKRRKGGMFILALGTIAGDVFALNVLNGEKMWTSEECHPGGATSLSFANKGQALHTAGIDGMVCELDSKTGVIIGKFKASRKPIASLVLSTDERFLAVGSDKIRVFSMENKKETGKFSADSVPVQYISSSDGGRAVVSSGPGEKQLHLWECNQERRTGTLMEGGVAYVWDLMTISQADVTPSRIVVKSVEAEIDQQKSAKKNRIPIIAARLHDLNKDSQISVIVAYGSPSVPQFNLLEITDPGEEVVITAKNETSGPGAVVGPQENGNSRAEVNVDMGHHNPKLEAMDATSENKRAKKKRVPSDPDLASAGNHVASGHIEVTDGINVDYDMNEPTMGEKLANLNILDEPTKNNQQKQDLSSDVKPPSADSVYVMLKQALHADDRALLLDCLYTQDEKVIANSTSLLNPSDVIKLLNFLLSMVQSRGGMLVCAIPWLRSLLLQHASGIMSQESSLRALNSLYQVIESRVSTFGSAMQLSSHLDYLFTGITDDVADEANVLPPIIFEDKDDSDEESGDAMETNEESEEIELSDEALGGFDSEGIDDMSD